MARKQNHEIRSSTAYDWTRQNMTTHEKLILSIMMKHLERHGTGCGLLDTGRGYGALMFNYGKIQQSQ